MQPAIIQMILADGEAADSVLAQWTFTKGLSHPHILKILDAGRCVMDDRELVYVVTESSDAALSKIMRGGMLEAARTREIFNPVLSALLYLHDSGVIHGHVNPSTIQFASAKPKLSVADVLIAGSVRRKIAGAGLYDAPELQHDIVSAVADTWSVGLVMYEAMTDAPLSLDSVENGRAQNVQSLPSPFREIVQDCLQLDPVRRCTIENILQRLDESNETHHSNAQVPVKMQIAPGATITPVSEIEPADELDAHLPAETTTEDPALFSKSFERFEEAHLTRFRVLPYAVVLLAALAVVSFLLVRRHNANSPSAVTSQIAKPESRDSVQEKQPSTSTASAPVPDNQSAAPVSPVAHQTEPEIKTPAAENPSQDAAQLEPPKTSVPSKPLSKSSSTASPTPINGETNGSVVKRVIPNASPGAFEGNPILVEAQVRVSVNKDGAVSNVEYISPGAGNYFARLAERAARSWQFTPPMQNGKPGPSVWVLRFYFARNQTEATAEREQRL
ncbi:protein kinase [Telmatobacter sp. DSM 110680]|uniref:non-specific serine/threonine protein kinase n=1 Tax=Telmatobacter sp. DSM 110680 TaxID=3036704 RepID=A0AAU7DFC7_9BACT